MHWNSKTGNITSRVAPGADPKTPDNEAKRGVGLGEGMIFGAYQDIRKTPAGMPPPDRPEPVIDLNAVDQKAEARGYFVWSFTLGGELNPLNAPPAPATVIKIAAPPGARG